MTIRTYGGYLPLTGGTLTGTLTAADGGTWASGGLTVAAASFVAWSGRSQMLSGADGTVTLLNAAGTGFTRLGFGGTTSSFPSFARSNANVQLGLADGSNWTNLQLGSLALRPDTALTAGGATNMSVAFSSSSVAIFAGSGAPTISAAQGSIYLRSDGSSTSTRLYVNTNGSTGWTNFTSAS